MKKRTSLPEKRMALARRLTILVNKSLESGRLDFHRSLSLSTCSWFGAPVSRCGFMPRETASKMIPVMTRAMPEKNVALGIHQYHGSGQGPLSGQNVGPLPPTRPRIMRTIPVTRSANLSVCRVYLSGRLNRPHVSISDPEA